MVVRQTLYPARVPSCALLLTWGVSGKWSSLAASLAALLWLHDPGTTAKGPVSWSGSASVSAAWAAAEEAITMPVMAWLSICTWAWHGNGNKTQEVSAEI